MSDDAHLPVALPGAEKESAKGLATAKRRWRIEARFH